MARGNEHERGSPPANAANDTGEDLLPPGGTGLTRERPSLDSPGVDDSEITLSIFIRVRPGREQDFEGYLQGFNEASSKFPGYIGARLFRPTRGDTRYRILLRFDSETNLRRWTDSEERQLWVERGEEFAEAPPLLSNITGTA